MDKLRAIEEFVRVIQCGNFTAAAATLGTSPSAVTKAVNKLEEDLGARLLNRTTRKVTPTDVGNDFYVRCVKILEDLQDAEAVASDDNAQRRGKVRVIAPILFGRTTIIPELKGFFETYPNIDLDITMSDNPIDHIQEGFDLAIRVGDIGDSPLIRRVLLRGPRTVVASTAYVAAHGLPTTLDELKDHRCVLGKEGSDWPFLVDGRRETVTVAGNLRVRGGGGVREAVLLGLGLGYSTRWVFRNDLQAGLVVSTLGAHVIEDIPISVVFHNRPYMPVRVRTVLDFLVRVTSD